MGDGNHHVFLDDQVFDREFLSRFLDFGAAVIAVLCSHLHRLILDDLHAHGLGVEDGFVSIDFLDQFQVLFFYLFPLQTGQPLQAHFEDGRGLTVGELEFLHQAGVSSGGIF